MQTLSLHSLSRALASNFAPRFSAQFWRNRQNTKCSGFSIDISLNSDIIESHQSNASQDCFAGVSFARGTRLNCTQIERRRNTMKIIKRNGAEVPFDITQDHHGSDQGQRFRGRQKPSDPGADHSDRIGCDDQCHALNRAVSVEEIQDMVENKLMDIQAPRCSPPLYHLSLCAEPEAPDQHHRRAHPQPDRVPERGSQAGERQQEPHREQRPA